MAAIRSRDQSTATLNARTRSSNAMTVLLLVKISVSN